MLGLLLVLVVATLAALPARPAHRVGVAGDRSQPVWREAWSRRFPGCVAVLLWPRDEAPRALVVRDGRARLTEVPVRQALLRSGEPGRRVVGVCR